jgi:hypothetical protein
VKTMIGSPETRDYQRIRDQRPLRLHRVPEVVPIREAHRAVAGALLIREGEHATIGRRHEDRREHGAQHGVGFEIGDRGGRLVERCARQGRLRGAEGTLQRDQPARDDRGESPGIVLTRFETIRSLPWRTSRSVKWTVSATLTRISATLASVSRTFSDPSRNAEDGFA